VAGVAHQRVHIGAGGHEVRAECRVVVLRRHVQRRLTFAVARAHERATRGDERRNHPGIAVAHGLHQGNEIRIVRRNPGAFGHGRQFS
jgi:hypothetical protein